ncbi:O-antigen translocase, partial [Acinetobacter junii]
TTFAGSAINTAVVKYTAEYHEDETKQRAVWKTAGSIVFLFSLVFAILILIFQKQLALYIFQSLKYQTIFIWFAVFLIFFNFNTLFLAIL